MTHNYGEEYVEAKLTEKRQNQTTTTTNYDETVLFKTSAMRFATAEELFYYSNKKIVNSHVIRLYKLAANYVDQCIKTEERNDWHDQQIRFQIFF